MSGNVGKRTWRAVRAFPGRYLAILLIVMLSVGFFAGLKVTKDAMVNTADGYLSEQKLYDFTLISTLGWREEDVTRAAEFDGVAAAQGNCYVDVLMVVDGTPHAVRVRSLTENMDSMINAPSLVAGRLPENAGEVLADKNRFGEDDIGKVIRLSADNDADSAERLRETEFTIVGIADSPLYIGLDRGSTNIGGGALHSFFYLPAEGFTDEVYTELSLTLDDTADAGLYSEEYDEAVADREADITALCEEMAQDRYEELLDEIREELTAQMMRARDEAILTQLAQAQAQMMTEEMLEQMREQLETSIPIPEVDEKMVLEVAAENGLTEPQTYVLTRKENAGVVSFENDSAIVSGIANIFPIFFILIAMLVCITTMTRMVDEERTQIGVLKAMGLSNGAIAAKYLLYAGSATVIGWDAGFFLGTWGLPQVFWMAYNALYDFAPLPYLFSPSLAVLTLAAALVGILGSTYLSCRRELAGVPAALIRPRAAKVGKRILLERVTPLWRRLKFLQKITLRNMFRYKRRLVMMLIGIGCCAGLVVTAFGVRDSMVTIGTEQFEEIQRYDMEVTFDAEEADVLTEAIADTDGIARSLTVSSGRVDVESGERTLGSVTLVGYGHDDAAALVNFWDFHDGEEQVALPADGEAIVNNKVARDLSLKVGDRVTVQDADHNELTVTVSGIFDNYIGNYVILNAATYERELGEWQPNTAYLAAGEGIDSEDIARELTSCEAVTGISRLAVTRENVDSALGSIHYIVWIVVAFSGALAFIVTFNLTNINLAERSREIATVQVLGFYRNETESYVLRENLVLSAIAAVLGLPLGKLFHHVVMNMIVVDSFAFHIHITPQSYVLGLVCTILFAFLVNQFMKRRIASIKMAESLKAVE